MPVTPQCADLEIGLERAGDGLYAASLRFSHPDSDADVRLGDREPMLVRLDLAALAGHALDPVAYGTALTAALLASPQLAAAFARAESAAAGLGAPLRMRLQISADAAALHAVRWELLRTPAGVPVGIGERVLFSRYLASEDWQPVPLLPRAALRALVVVANPVGLADYGLAPIDAPAELVRLRTALAGVEVDALAGPGQATLDGIADALRDGVDVLCLVAHGACRRGESSLWLDGEDGQVARVPGAALAARIAALQLRPRLVVLASCESAGADQDQDQADLAAALGPTLARAGVAAVVAMQGRLSLATAALLLPRFFQELVAHGQVDRALALARESVQDRSDAWLPVLFMRLRSGRIWYVPGFGGDGETFERWPALLQSIRGGRCTPVVGPALGDPLHGSARELAIAWAEVYRYPLAAAGRTDLSQVAQYMAIDQDDAFPRAELLRSLTAALRRRYHDALPAADLPLDEALAAVADWRAARGQIDAYALLAGLPCPLYITAATDGLLASRLRARGKQPRLGLCAWHPDIEADPAAADGADEAHPLVFHVFGHHSQPDSLVLTEDDVYAFLIGVTRDRELIPARVRSALVDSALLFLGFSVDDWKFRVFFRSLMDQAGGRRRRRYAHVAAQIDPEGGDASDPERARRYLASYFQGADITIFWGTADDFLRQLADRLAKGTA